MVQSWHDAPPRPKSHRQKSIEPVSIVFVPEDSPFLIGLAGYYPHRSEYWEAEQFSTKKKQTAIYATAGEYYG